MEPPVSSFFDAVKWFLVPAQRTNAIGVIWGLAPEAVLLSTLFPPAKEVVGTLILDPDNRLFEYAEYVRCRLPSRRRVHGPRDRKAAKFAFVHRFKK